MRGFRIRTCSQGGWPPGRAPGQLRPRCRPLHQTARAHRPCRVHTHSTTGSRLNSLQWSLHILTAVHAPPATARCSIRWSWSPCRTAWPYFPLGSSRPRCRSRTPPPSIRVCGREVESGRVMACPGCGQGSSPRTESQPAPPLPPSPSPRLAARVLDLPPSRHWRARPALNVAVFARCRHGSFSRTGRRDPGRRQDRPPAGPQTAAAGHAWLSGRQ